MLVIRRCLFGSSGGAEDNKLKYYDIPPIAGDSLPLISTDSLHHVPPKQAQPQPELNQVEDGSSPEIEPDHDQPEQIKAEEEPQPTEDSQESKVSVSEPQTQDLSALFGLRDPDRRSLSICTEILGSESCDNMVAEMSEAVTEWSWKKVPVEKEILANRRFPPPIPRYAGRPCRFMKIKRGEGRVRMSLVEMDRLPEQMLVERYGGQIKMQLMTHVGDDHGANHDAEASTSGESGSYKEEELAGTDEWDSSEKRELAVAA